MDTFQFISDFIFFILFVNKHLHLSPLQRIKMSLSPADLLYSPESWSNESTPCQSIMTPITTMYATMAPSPLFLSQEDVEIEDIPFLDNDHYDGISKLNIDPLIVEQYKPLPVLFTDPSEPIFLHSTTPVYDRVEDLLQIKYKGILDPQSERYQWHLQRLKQNREALEKMKKQYAIQSMLNFGRHFGNEGRPAYSKAKRFRSF